MLRDLIFTGLIIGVMAASAASAQPVVSFTRTPPGDILVGEGPAAVAVGDFDGNGKMDIAVANNDSDDVSVLLGNGNGTFQTPTNYTAGEVVGPFAIAVGDLNHDGKPDIVTANETGNSVSVLLNQGAGVFGAPIETPVGNSPSAVVIGDFDGDQFLDVATADNFDGTVTILKGVGDGTFTDPQTIEVGECPEGLAAAFLDSDDNIDLVVTNGAGGPDSTGSITVLKGLGGGVFQAQPEIVVTCGAESCVPVAVAVGDLNHDGKLDLALANNEGDTVSVMLGNGDLTFQNGASVSVAPIPSGVVIEDFTGDGIADVASSSFFDDKVSVLIGVGNGTFVTPNSQTAAAAAAGATTLVLANASGFPVSGTVQVGDDRLNYTGKTDNTLTLAMPLSQAVAAAATVTFVGMDFDVGSAPAGLAAGAFNADHKPDLVVANQDDGTVSVLLNTSGANACLGDCNGDGQVTVDEILIMVNIALGTVPVDECLAGDGNNDTQITVDEILAAVNNALTMCPA